MNFFYDNKIEKENGNVRGLQLKKYYYAELKKNGKRVDYIYSDASDKETFDDKIKEWKQKYENA